MQITQTTWRSSPPDAQVLSSLAANPPDWILAFGPEVLLRAAHPALVAACPHSVLMGCSTAGEISREGVSDQTLALTAVHWRGVVTRQSSTDLLDMEDSFQAGVRLARGLPRQGLRAIVLLGQGVQINGTALIQGMTREVGADIPVVGGLAGDSGAFVQTAVMDGQGVSATRLVCAGLYGDDLRVSHGVFGGWSPFGPARRITKADRNVLFSLDGEPALAMYKRYLGDYAKDLPASGLLFPFSVVATNEAADGLLRTILSVDEAAGSITFAGEVEEGGYVRMMQAGTDALVQGAEQAAQALQLQETNGLALMVSCVGRKLVMGGRVEEEIEAVAAVLGADATLAGFYSYGEISPAHNRASCLLHNQTMTITYLSEAA
ncbi:FIST N-terminal domain-containing protein [Rhodoferax sp.]|uniref:FIST signal transduction protein n=1 Tax=Rhodoferax sp. TaxID=50421 RepID=UPI0025F229B9|nr:FIST N-terminal domain-containing protein [Rhodoferax sp.]